MKWVVENGQWLFDGVGGAFAIAVIGWIGSALFNRSRDGGQQQRGGNNSINVQAGRDANFADLPARKK
ncbi:MAG TPA: hypothetical protein VG320_10640 [Paraburkholderia sp.]|jgi:hypothetical protein|uniref:hypothetical protein n=1 Tax=Paraburkholderia sp. TaxID=1926495 RepID=UPI002DE9DAD5|nr:hypothetical protein [Paraburkholderia sp.]